MSTDCCQVVLNNILERDIPADHHSTTGHSFWYCMAYSREDSCEYYVFIDDLAHLWTNSYEAMLCFGIPAEQHANILGLIPVAEKALVDDQYTFLTFENGLFRAVFLGRYEIHFSTWMSQFDHAPREVPKQTTQPIFQPTVDMSNRIEYVYLIRSNSGHYKIGRTSNPNNRLKTFEVKLPFEVEYEHLIPTSNARKLESALHKRYAQKRVNGEWFSLNSKDVAEIKKEIGL